MLRTPQGDPLWLDKPVDGTVTYSKAFRGRYFGACCAYYWLYVDPQVPCMVLFALSLCNNTYITHSAQRASGQTSQRCPFRHRLHPVLDALSRESRVVSPLQPLGFSSLVFSPSHFLSSLYPLPSPPSCSPIPLLYLLPLPSHPRWRRPSSQP